MPDRVVNCFAVFNKHLEKKYCSDIKFVPQPLISTTMTRCPANFMNLSAIIVELSLAEYDSKLRRYLQIAINGFTPDVFKILPKIRILRILLQHFAQHV